MVYFSHSSNGQFGIKTSCSKIDFEQSTPTRAHTAHTHHVVQNRLLLLVQSKSFKSSLPLSTSMLMFDTEMENWSRLEQFWKNFISFPLIRFFFLVCVWFSERLQFKTGLVGWFSWVPPFNYHSSGFFLPHNYSLNIEHCVCCNSFILLNFDFNIQSNNFILNKTICHYQPTNVTWFSFNIKSQQNSKRPKNDVKEAFNEFSGWCDVYESEMFAFGVSERHFDDYYRRWGPLVAYFISFHFSFHVSEFGSVSLGLKDRDTLTESRLYIDQWMCRCPIFLSLTSSHRFRPNIYVKYTCWTHQRTVIPHSSLV